MGYCDTAITLYNIELSIMLYIWSLSFAELFLLNKIHHLKIIIKMKFFFTEYGSGSYKIIRKFFHTNAHWNKRYL